MKNNNKCSIDKNSQMHIYTDRACAGKNLICEVSPSYFGKLGCHDNGVVPGN